MCSLIPLNTNFVVVSKDVVTRLSNVWILLITDTYADEHQ